MKLLEFREKIQTECSLMGSPILHIQALKIDDNKTKRNLKQQLGCKNLKSCDYFRRKKRNLYFIELSDFQTQLKQLSQLDNDEKAKKVIKEEVRLKLSETLLLHHQMIKNKYIKGKNLELKNKALLTLCSKTKADSITFAFLSRDLERHYCPTHLSSIKIIPYTELENTFKR